MRRSFVSIAVAAVFTFSSLQSSQAQREVETFLGIGLGLMQMGIQADQAKRQQQQAQQARNAEIARQREAEQRAEREFFKRVQTALKKLGFYTKEIDGVTGPGTRAAIADFQRAFRISGEFDEYALDTLEWAAVDGWRSLAEMEKAQGAGFDSRHDYIKGQEGGFATADQYWSAQDAGFSKLSEYQAFVASGAQSKTEFETERNKVAAAETAVDKCLVATRAGNWVDAIMPCQDAAVAKPNDDAAQIALQTVLTNLTATQSQLTLELSNKRADLQKLLNQPGANSGTEQTNRLRAEIQTLVNNTMFAGLHVQIGTCRELVAAQNWDKALPACYVNSDTSGLDVAMRRRAENLVAELRTHRKSAEEGVAASKAAMAEESKRLALVEAKAKAEDLLEDVGDYSGKGNTFVEGLAVARQLVELRKAVDGNDAAPIERSLAALDTLFVNDTKFIAARNEKAQAEVAAAQTAALEARRQAELLDAFVLSYISTNVTSDHVTTLLPINEKLSVALAQSNGELITQAQAEARSVLEKVGLIKDFSAYVASANAPIVTAAVLQEAEAQTVSETKAIEAAIAHSNGLIEEIEAFAKGGGKFGSPVEVARSLSRLKSALAAPSLPDLQVAHDTTRALVDSDAAFAEAMLNRASTADASLANAIASAGYELNLVNDYLLTYISANLTADNIGDIVDIQLAVENALSVPETAETVRTLQNTEKALADLGLVEEVREFAERAITSQITAAGVLTDSGLPITLANSELLEGPGDDFLVLRNSAAPHVAFDLVGNLRVDGPAAEVCWLHPPLENPISLLMARQALIGRGVDRLNLSYCENPLSEADFAILRRGDFLALEAQKAQPLVAAFEDGRLKTLIAIAAEAASAEAKKHELEASIIANRIEDQTARGYGLLHLTAGSQGICPVVGSLDEHRPGLQNVATSIGFYFDEANIKPAIKSEQAFVGAQRGQCSGIYASASDLRTLTAALTKADIAYSVTPIWITEETVEAEVVRLAEVSADAQVQAAQRKQDEEASAALLAAQTADQRSELQKLQDQQRAEYRDRAIAAQKEIAETVDIKLAGKDHDKILRGQYPATDALIDRLFEEKWKFTAIADALQDYGTAVWRGRGIEAVIVRLTTTRESAVLGQYVSDCWIHASLIDREFHVTRDHIALGCDDTVALDTWRDARNFQSVWNLVPAN